MVIIRTLLERYREIFAYLIFGVLTVVVNTVVFLIFSELPIGDMWANTIAFFIAVQFAYMTNTKFVFRDKYTKENFLKFWGMRIGTIFIDNGGMWLLLSMDCNKILAKCFVNVVVIVLNYIFSKFFIYKRKEF